MQTFQNKLKDVRTHLDEVLNRLLPVPKTQEKRVVEAMRYSCLNAGKAVRPFLVVCSAELFAPSTEAVWQVAAALEMIHTYSLIHDDLPAMDNDDLRRGKPSCHKQFDEATAILAGDALLTYAFEVIAQAQDISAAKKCKLSALLAHAAGFQGMVGGQMLDLLADSRVKMSLKDLQRLQELKTGCLLQYACEGGAVLGAASAKDKKILVRYARAIGRLFQITDDILDVEGSKALMGKTLHKDAQDNKATYVSLLGMAQAKQLADELETQAVQVLKPFGKKADMLVQLAHFVRSRDH